MLHQVPTSILHQVLTSIQDHPFLEDASFTHFVSPDEVVYMPDTLESGRRICTEIDYTHIDYWLAYKNSVVAGKIPNINPEGWRSVAQLADILGKPMTNLTVLIVDSSGADQMSFTQTLTFFRRVWFNYTFTN